MLDRNPDFIDLTEREEPMNETMNNLKHKIQEALMQDPRTKEYGVEVVDNNGVIILRGAIPSHEARDKVEMVVKEVPGISSVINELDVV
jgi:osmotically-inducible protein OsmY